MATREEIDGIIDDVRRTMDAMLALTEQKIAELIRTVDEAYRARIEALDDAMIELQDRRSDQERPLN
jgi:hypothetical protein